MFNYIIFEYINVNVTVPWPGQSQSDVTWAMCVVWGRQSRAADPSICRGHCLWSSLILCDAFIAYKIVTVGVICFTEIEIDTGDV